MVHIERGQIQETEESYPYDRGEWERRLDEARVRRAEAIAAREARLRLDRAGHQSSTAMPPAGKVAEAAAPSLPAFAGDPAARDVEAGGVRRGKGSWLIVAAALVVGGVAGAAVSTLYSTPPSLAGQSADADPDASPETSAMASAEAAGDTGGPRIVALPSLVLSVPRSPELAGVSELAQEAAEPPLWQPGALAALPAVPPRGAEIVDAPTPVRIVVHIPPSVAAETREDTLADLRKADWPIEDALTTPFTISKTHIRYYHAADREAAGQLATLVEAEARDFTDFSPQPETGLLEVWLAGKAPVRGSGRAAAARQADAIGLAGVLNRVAASLAASGGTAARGSGDADRLVVSTSRARDRTVVPSGEGGKSNGGSSPGGSPSRDKNASVGKGGAGGETVGAGTPSRPDKNTGVGKGGADGGTVGRSTPSRPDVADRSPAGNGRGPEGNGNSRSEGRGGPDRAEKDGQGRGDGQGNGNGNGQGKGKS